MCILKIIKMQIGSRIAGDFKEQIKHFIVGDSDFSFTS